MSKRTNIKDFTLRIEEMVRRYSAGESLTDLSRGEDVSISFVRKLLLEAGVPMRGGRPLKPAGVEVAFHEAGVPMRGGQPLTGKLMDRPLVESNLSDEQIRQRYEDQKCVLAIAEEAGIAPPKVRKILVLQGVTIRKRGRNIGSKTEGVLSLAQRDALCADIRACETPTSAALGRKYGVSRQTVLNYAKSIGVTYYSLGRIRADFAARRASVQAQRDLALAAKTVAKEEKLDRLAKMWNEGAKKSAIFAELGIANAGLMIVGLRKTYPGRFAYRMPRITPAVAKQRAAIAALWRGREAERIALMEKLWNEGASPEEVAEKTGLKDAWQAIKRYQKRFPERFPQRKAGENPFLSAAHIAAAASRKVRLLEKVALLAMLWNAGASSEEIAEKTGILNVHNAIYYYGRRFPDRFSQRNVPINPFYSAAKIAASAQQNAERLEKVALLEQFWEEGASIAEISQKTGLNDVYNAIRRYRRLFPDRFPFRYLTKKAALQQRDDGDTAPKVALLEQLWKEGASVKEITEKTGFSDVYHAVGYYRERFPDRFPFRQLPTNWVPGTEEAANLAQVKMGAPHKVALLEQLWKGGASIGEISQKTGFKDVIHAVGYYRERFPDRFPHRSMRRKPISCTQPTAGAAQWTVEQFQRVALLEQLWKEGASIAEISQKTGFKDVIHAVSYYRKHFPDRFPSRVGKAK